MRFGGHTHAEKLKIDVLESLFWSVSRVIQRKKCQEMSVNRNAGIMAV